MRSQIGRTSMYTRALHINVNVCSNRQPSSSSVFDSPSRIYTAVLYSLQYSWTNTRPQSERVNRFFKKIGYVYFLQ